MRREAAWWSFKSPPAAAHEAVRGLDAKHMPRGASTEGVEFMRRRLVKRTDQGCCECEMLMRIQVVFDDGGIGMRRDAGPAAARHVREKSPSPSTGQALFR